MKAAPVAAMIARRFLASRHSERFLSLVAAVSVVGVAMGVAALVVVTSVVNGFEGEISKVVTGLHGDVVLYSRGEPVERSDEIETRAKKVVPTIQAVTQGFVSELMVAGPNGVAGMVWEGVDPTTASQVLRLEPRVTQGSFVQGPGELILGRSLAERIGVAVGDTVRLVAPLLSEGAPKTARARIVGIADLGMHQYNSKFGYSLLSDVRTFFERPNAVTSLKFRLAPGADADASAALLGQAFGFPLRAKSWRELNHNLFYAIELEKIVISLLLAVIVVVAAFNVVSTLMILLHEKSQSLAILKAVGFSPSQQFRLLTLIGLGLGVVGTLAGLGLGLMISAALSRFHLLDLPPEVYHITFLPVEIRGLEVLAIGVTAVTLALLVTLVPAWRASRQFPLEGLRNE